jgi:hypothetical protein
MVSQKLLGSQTRGGNAQLPFAGIPIPKDVENTQHFVGGSTGTGKSVCMSQYIESAVARGDRIICVDPDGASMRYFFRPGGVILNPFDKRGQGWSILNEIRTSFDCEQRQTDGVRVAAGPRITKCGDVVDIDSEAQRRIGHAGLARGARR